MSVLKLLWVFIYYIFIFSGPAMCAVKVQEGNLSGLFSSGRFGLFYVTTKSVDKCQPTKQLDMERMFVYNIYVAKVSRQAEEYKGYLYIPMDIQLQEVRMHMVLMKAGKQPVPLYEKFSNNFCQDGFFLNMVKFILKPDKNCLVKKYNYTITGINVNNLIHMMTGEYFIHESIQFNLEFFTKKGSIFCYQTIIESKQLRGRKIAPKTPSTSKSTQIIQS